MFKRRDRWPLRAWDLPPARARRASAELHGLEENALFRWLHLEARSGRGRGSSLAAVLRRANAKEKFTAQVLNDLWLTGVGPEQIASAMWGYYAAAKFRSIVLGVSAVFVGALLLSVAGVLAGAIRPGALDDKDMAIGCALAVAYLQGALFYQGWMALNVAHLVLKVERDRWERRASTSRSFLRQAKAALIILGIVAGVAAVVALFIWAAMRFPLLTYWDSLVRWVAPIGRAFASLSAFVPPGLRPAFWGAVAGTILAHVGGMGAKKSARKNYEKCVKHAEETYRFWLEVGESQPAAAPPRR